MKRYRSVEPMGKNLRQLKLYAALLITSLDARNSYSAGLGGDLFSHQKQ